MKKKVAISDGHEMWTPGKRTPKIKELGDRVIHENEFNKAVALLLEVQLKRCGFDVINVSSTNNDTLYDRVARANAAEADIFIAIHYNAFDGQFDNYDPEGLSVHVYPGAEEDRKLAECIHKFLINGTVQKDRGIKESDFYVLRNTKMPAILSENGFMDNKKEALLMLDKNFQEEVAKEHCKGICQYFGLPYVDEVDESENIESEYNFIKDKINLSDITMKYLQNYKYGNELIQKIAAGLGYKKAVAIATKKTDVKFEQYKNRYGFTINYMWADIKKLFVKAYEYGISNKKLPFENCVNGTFFTYQKDGKYFSTSILYSNGKIYKNTSNHNGHPQSCFIIYKNGTLEMKRLYNLDGLNLSNIEHVLGGVGLINKLDKNFKYNPTLEGFSGRFADVLEKRPKTILGWRKEEPTKIYLITFPLAHHKEVIASLLDEEFSYDLVLGLDGGGSTAAKNEDKYVLEGDGRKIHNIIGFN